MLTWQGFVWSDSNDKQRWERFSSLQTQKWLIEKSERGSQCCIYWTAGTAGGGATDVAGRVPSSAHAIGWRCRCAVERHQPMFSSLVFLLIFFLSVDFADIENLGGWVINKQGTPCDVWTRPSRSVRMHISLRSTLSPKQCCNSGFFFFFFCADESSDYTDAYNTWPHCRILVVCLGQSY